MPFQTIFRSEGLVALVTCETFPLVFHDPFPFDVLQGATRRGYIGTIFLVFILILILLIPTLVFPFSILFFLFFLFLLFLLLSSLSISLFDFGNKDLLFRWPRNVILFR